MFRDISFKKTFTPLVIVINILVFVIIVMFFRINHVNREKDIQAEQTQDIASNINDYYKKKLEIIRTISTIRQIVQISEGNIFPTEELLTANLTSIKIIIGASLLFQMDSSGSVIASSTYEGSKTLLNNNYKFRPYFTDAMKGNNSFYTAVGVTTGERGMYFGFPVRNNTKVAGVVVVKFNLTSIDEIIEQSGLSGGMISPDGIIFSSPVKKWLFSSTGRLSPERRIEIKNSRQLGRFNIGRFPYDIKSEKVTFRGKPHFTSEIDLEIKGWKLFTFYLQDIKLNYLYPSLVFLFLLIIELLVINSIREFRNRRVSEITLRKSRERFRYLFESSMDSILILDHKNNIVAANPVTEKVFGYSVKELEGLKFRILFHGDAQRECKKHIRTVKIELKGRIEFHGRRRDGTSMYVDCSMVYLRGEKEEESIFFITCNDITAKWEADILLHNAKEEAEKANKSKSEFLANMSHEIRTPMTAILGYSELLEVSELNEKQKEYIDIIKISGESLLYLIDEILDFSKIEAGKVIIEKKNFELKKLLDKTEKTTKIWIKDKKVTLNIKVDKEVPGFLCGDPERLRQILRNLLNNAVKFTEEGEIDLDVRLRKELDPWVSLEFTVSDTGIGISKDNTDKLFKSFSQIDSALSRKYEGTGLGLAITAKLVEMMGGKLHVESDLGKGALFRFSVNFGKADSGGIEEEEIDQSKAGSDIDLSEYSILIVEDNSVNRMLLEYTLKKEGFEVVTAINGTEAMRWIGEMKFDVVLMDIQMPGKDGVEVTREIRKTSQKDVPVIALTANAMKGDREKYISLGLDDYLSKPIKKRDLINTVIKWIVESKG